jgi:hypothetical protein
MNAKIPGIGIDGFCKRRKGGRGLEVDTDSELRKPRISAEAKKLLAEIYLKAPRLFSRIQPWAGTGNFLEYNSRIVHYIDVFYSAEGAELKKNCMEIIRRGF